ncbi:NAD(P)H-hydrate dehydratase [Nocardioides sp. 616]|uniref:NAD(P)H-hydrate dehydratase n=1 Tax=Nocardioides sp. 616 TaxID=2268090 RepID=UPI000CE2E5DA|nr:NAD(P)H-hydrate dehydratase [Nocardioides sp. 616]
MLRAHTVAQVRAAEAEVLAVLPDGALMARAAAGLATGIATGIAERLGRTYGARVLLLLGPGDNGGDALHAGALLARRGAQVWGLALAPAVHPAGLAALRAAGGRLVELDEAVALGADVVVDGIVGIGGRPGLRPDAAAALEALAGIPVVAVDVPSGVDVDSGELDGPHVRAEETWTFGTHKVAHLVDPAAAAAGRVRLVDLGLALPAPEVCALEAEDVARLLPRPDAAAHKYSRGVVGVRAGSATYAGAAVLCVRGALSGLAGMVRYVGPEAVGHQVRSTCPEVVGEGRVQAWVVGPGSDDQAGPALAAALADQVPVVVDADALAHLTPSVPGARLVLTPHAGELAALLGVARPEVEAAPLRHAREAARTLHATVLLKGRRTLVADPSGAVRVNTTGTPWLATAGAGDVLAGVVGALLASGLSGLDAASVGAWLHGRAAELAGAGGPLRAGDVAGALGPAVNEVLALVGE